MCAYLYEINNTGYAILNLADWTVSEYSLSVPSYYSNIKGRKYYSGIFRYFFSDNDTIYSLPEQKTISSELRAEYANAYCQDYRAISEFEKQSLMQSYETTSASTNSVLTTSSNSLPHSLSTGYKNNYCGPTAIATMMWYYGTYVNSRYKGGNSTKTALINSLINYIDNPVSLSTLKKGCNDFFTDFVISNTAYSCSYSFSRVVSCIDSGKPITIGGSASAFDPSNTGGGHIGVVHGYSYTTNPGDPYYVLKVNDSWGHNNVSISYYRSAPSTLADHIYFAN